MNQWHKLGTNVFMMGIGSIGSKLIVFLMLPLYTSTLSSEEYGISDLILVTINLLIPVLTLVINEAILRFALDKEVEDNQVFTIGLIINIIGGIFLFFLIPLLNFLPPLNLYRKYFILYYFSYVFYNFISNFMIGIGKVSMYTILNIFQTVLLTVGNIIVLVFLKLGIKGYLLVFIFSYFISTILLFLIGEGYKYIISFLKIKKLILKEMLKYSVPMIPNTLSWWINNSADKYLVTLICGVEINGIYSIAYKIPTILSIFISIFMSAWRLSATDNFGSQESENFYNEVYRKLESFIIMITAGIILTNKILAKFLYINEFYSAWKYVPILVLAFAFHGLSEFFGSIYTSAKKTTLLFYSSLSGAIINIILNLILIPICGGIGAAIATVISHLLILIIRILHSQKFVIIRIDYKNNILLLLLLLMMCFIQFLEGKLSYLLGLGLFIFIFYVRRKEVYGIYMQIFNEISKKIKKN